MSRRLRGWVDIHRMEGGGFVAYDWSEHYDSGVIISEHRTHGGAVRAAMAWAEEHDRKLGFGAEIVPFPGGAA